VLAPTHSSEVPLSLWDVHFREITIAGAFGRGTAFRWALTLIPTLGVGRSSRQS